MSERVQDLRDCPTAYECRDRLPELSAWLDEDALKLIPIWKGTRFERGQTYFDLNHPERGPFVATGDEGTPSDYTYVSRAEVPEQVWARLATWRQPISEDQGRAIDLAAEEFAIEPDRGGERPGPYAAQ